MAKGEERKGPIFYYEWQDQISQLPENYQLAVIKGIWQYDRYGEKLDTQDGLLAVLMEKYYFEIDKQKSNWEAKAGRPAKYTLDMFLPYFEQGLRDTDIARELGCSSKTVQRKRKEWESSTYYDGAAADTQTSEKLDMDKDKEEYVSFVLSRTSPVGILSNFVQSDKDIQDKAKELGF